MTRITELKNLCARNQSTLLQDALGVVSLSVMLMGALHLPSFF